MYTIECTLPGTSLSTPPTIQQLAPFNIDGDEWYAKFRDRCLASIGKHWLPVCRLADGEFQFACGWCPSKSLAPKALIQRLLWMGGFYDPSRQPTMWGEKYDRQIKAQLQQKYGCQLAEVSRKGYLGLFLAQAGSSGYPKNPSTDYAVPLLKWFASYGIKLSPDNYVPFHFVFSLLIGPDRQKLITDKRILVATSLNNLHRTEIEDRLIKAGAESIHFLTVSRTNAMLDKIKLENLPTQIDLVLVGAGIGSVSVITQLASLQTLCIDAGRYIDALSDPSKVIHRAYSVDPNMKLFL